LSIFQSFNSASQINTTTFRLFRSGSAIEYGLGITLKYTQGTVQSVQGSLLHSFTGRNVLNSIPGIYNQTVLSSGVNLVGVFPSTGTGDSNRAGAFNVSTQNLVSRISLPNTASGWSQSVIFNSTLNKILIGVEDNTVRGYSPTTLALTQTFNLSSGDDPVNICVLPNASRMYVTAQGTGRLHGFYTSSGAEFLYHQIDPSDWGMGIVSTPDNSKLFMVTRQDKLCVLDTLTAGTLFYDAVWTPYISASPYDILMDPAGSFVYTASNQFNSIYKISTSSYTISQTYSVGSDGSYKILLNPAGTYIYGTRKTAGATNIFALNLSTGGLTTIQLGKVVVYFNLSISPDGAYVYATHSDGTYSKISTATNSVVGNYSF